MLPAQLCKHGVFDVSYWLEGGRNLVGLDSRQAQDKLKTTQVGLDSRKAIFRFALSRTAVNVNQRQNCNVMALVVLDSWPLPRLTPSQTAILS